MTEELTAAHLRELGNMLAGASAGERERMYKKAATHVRDHSDYITQADIKKLVDMFKEAYPGSPVPDLARMRGGLSKSASPYVLDNYVSIAAAAAAGIALLFFLGYIAQRRRQVAAPPPAAAPPAAPPAALPAAAAAPPPAAAAAPADQVRRHANEYKDALRLARIGMRETDADINAKLTKMEQRASNFRDATANIQKPSNEWYKAECETLSSELHKTYRLADLMKWTDTRFDTMVNSMKNIVELFEGAVGIDPAALKPMAPETLGGTQVEIIEMLRRMVENLEMICTHADSIVREIPVHLLDGCKDGCRGYCRDIRAVESKVNDALQKYVREAPALINIILAKHGLPGVRPDLKAVAAPDDPADTFRRLRNSANEYFEARRSAEDLIRPLGPIEEIAAQLSRYAIEFERMKNQPELTREDLRGACEKINIYMELCITKATSSDDINRRLSDMIKHMSDKRRLISSDDINRRLSDMIKHMSDVDNEIDRLLKAGHHDACKRIPEMMDSLGKYHIAMIDDRNKFIARINEILAHANSVVNYIPRSMHEPNYPALRSNINNVWAKERMLLINYFEPALALGNGILKKCGMPNIPLDLQAAAAPDDTFRQLIVNVNAYLEAKRSAEALLRVAKPITEIEAHVIRYMMDFKKAINSQAMMTDEELRGACEAIRIHLSNTRDYTHRLVNIGAQFNEMLAHMTNIDTLIDAGQHDVRQYMSGVMADLGETNNNMMLDTIEIVKAMLAICQHANSMLDDFPKDKEVNCERDCKTHIEKILETANSLNESGKPYFNRGPVLVNSILGKCGMPRHVFIGSRNED